MRLNKIIFCQIWANVQAEETPRRMRFDLTKRADWFPCFGKNISPPSNSVQPETIDYRITSKYDINFFFTLYFFILQLFFFL